MLTPSTVSEKGTQMFIGRIDGWAYEWKVYLAQIPYPPHPPPLQTASCYLSHE